MVAPGRGNRYISPNRLFTTTPTVKPEFRFPPIIFKILILISFIGAAIYFLFFSPFLRVANIIVEGDVGTEINDYVSELKGRNILFLRVNTTQDYLLAKYPRIHDISIFRGLPDTLKIRLNERKRILVWQTQEKSYLVDSGGVVYQLLESQEQLPNEEVLVVDTKNLAVSAPQVILSQEFIEFVTSAKTQLNERFKLTVEKFEIGETTFQVQARLKGGYAIKFDTTRKLEYQLDALDQALAKHIEGITEYIDVRVPGWVYYK